MADGQRGVDDQAGQCSKGDGRSLPYQRDGGMGSSGQDQGEVGDGGRKGGDHRQDKQTDADRRDGESEWWTESWRDHRGIDLSTSGREGESGGRDGDEEGTQTPVNEDSQGGGSHAQGETRRKKLSYGQVLPLVVEAESVAWRRGEALLPLEVPLMGTCCEDPIDTLYTALLRHGRCVVNIHRYFSNLESRKCCLNLAAVQTTFSNFRLVGRDGENSADDTGSLGPARVVAPLVDKLSEKDLEVYRQGLLCALFPILGVPAPPSPDPRPVTSRRGHPSHDLHQKDPNRTSGRKQPRLASDPGMAFTSDPGMAFTSDPGAAPGLTCDPDDLMTSVIPSETLCEVLRQAFGLSKQRAAKYERLVLEPYKKKTHAKVLAEELSKQFSLLENDKHSFYGPRSFLTREAYERWKHMQRRQLGEQINKFWPGSLPALKGALCHDTTRSHENYQLLLTKLMTYEAGLRGEDIVSVLSGPLSTASLRLLKEFGLRYGVGELYRRAVYLTYLSDHFEMEVWYIRHINALLISILQSFPTNRNKVIMVHEEYNLLYKAVMVLHEQCDHSLTRMKRLFLNQQPAEGIGCLLTLLTYVLELKAYLLDKHQNPVRHFLLAYAKANVAAIYKRHKMVAMADLKMDPSTTPTPALLSRLIAAMRDELIDYRLNYSSIFSKYFDLVLVATQHFYTHLMEDVSALCESSTTKQVRPELDLRLLSLAYRLHQLDTDWKDIVPLRHQTWRQSFRPVMLGWLTVLQTHCERLTMQAVGSDKFVSLELQECELRSPPMSRPSSTVSASSITPSESSAFAPVTPKRTRSTEEDPSLRDWLTNSMQLEASASFTPRDLTLTQPPEGFSRHQAKTSETSFIQTQTETSFTYRRRPTFLFDEDMRIINDQLPEAEEMAKSDGGGLGSGNTEILLPGQSDTKENDTKCDQTESRRGSAFTPDKEESAPDTGSNNTGIEKGRDLHQADDKGKGGRQSEHGKSWQDTPLVVLPEADSIEHAKEYSISLNQNRTDPIAIQPDISEDGGIEERDTEHALLMLNDGEVKKKFLTESLECHAKSYGDSFRYDDEVKEMLEGLESSSQGSSSASSETAKSVVAISETAEGPTKAAAFSRDVIDTTTDTNQQAFDSSTSDRINEVKPAVGDVFPRTDNIVDMRASHENEVAGCGINVLGGMGNARSPTLTTPTLSEPPSQQSLPESLASLSGDLSISGSLVDITTLLQRVIDFGQVLAQTLYPIGWQSDEEMIVWLASPEIEEEAKEEEITMRHETLAARTQIYEKILQVVCTVMCLYADNLLCSDLCGTREHKAHMLAGKQLVEEVMEQKEAGKIWGCRHMARGVKNCFTFVDRKTRLLTDRFEPISEEMTLRINNLHSMLAALPQIQANLSQALDLERMEEIHQALDMYSDSELLEDFVVVETFPRCAPGRHACRRCHGESHTSSSWRLTAGRSRTTSERSGQRSEGGQSSECQRSPEVFPEGSKEEPLSKGIRESQQCEGSTCHPTGQEEPAWTASGIPRESPRNADSMKKSRSWKGSPQRSLRGSSDLSSLRYLRGSWGSWSSLRVGTLHDRTEVIFGHCGYHMERVQKALANILAHRVNLFFRRALSLLVSIGLPLVGVEARLQPLTCFLDNHLSTLHTWLYEDTYQVVVDKLWHHIAKDFQSEASKLISPNNFSEAQPEILLQTIALFIKYFHQNGKGLSLPDITEKVSKPLQWLGLYTETTPHLICLYRHLYLHLTTSPSAQSADLTLPPQHLILRMRCELHGDKKCFSGRELVDWFIVHDTDLSPTTDELAMLDDTMEDLQVKADVAVDIGQVLLDRGVLSNVEEEPLAPDPSLPRALIPRRVPNQPYPTLSLDSYGAVLPPMARARTNDSLTGVLQDEQVMTPEGHHRERSMTSEGHHRERSMTPEGHGQRDRRMTFDRSCDMGSASTTSSEFMGYRIGIDLQGDEGASTSISGDKDNDTETMNTDTRTPQSMSCRLDNKEITAASSEAKDKDTDGNIGITGSDDNAAIGNSGTCQRTENNQHSTGSEIEDTMDTTAGLATTKTESYAVTRDTNKELQEGDKVPFYIDTTSPSASNPSEPTSSVTSSVFQPTSHHFYRFSSICDECPDFQGQSYTSEASEVTPDHGQLERAKELYELYDVTPQLVLQVLAARKHENEAARRFLKRVGAHADLGDPWDEGPMSSGCFGCGS